MQTSSRRLRSAERTQEVLKNFDSLSDSTHVRLQVVCGLYACSRATVYRRVAEELLPKPKKLGPRLSAWNVGELRRCPLSRA